MSAATASRWAMWLDECEVWASGAHQSRRTIETRRSRLVAFVRRYPSSDPRTVTRGDLLGFMRDANLTLAAARSQRSAFRVFFGELHRRGYRPDDPTSGFPSAESSYRPVDKPAIPGGQYGYGVSRLDEHCRWMIRLGRADATIKQRRMQLQYLGDFLGHDPISATTAELEHWQDTLPRQQIRLKTAMIRPYFKWVAAKGYRTDDPSVLLVMPKPKRGLPRPIETVNLWVVLDAAQRDARLHSWLLLAAYGGMRAKEIALLWVDDFVLTTDAIFVHLKRTKGERERVVAVPRWVWDVIAPRLPASGPCWERQRGIGAVTPQQVSQHCNNHLRRCGVPSTLHALRHWAGTEMLHASRDLRLTQDFLGHSDPAMTAVYTLVHPVEQVSAVEAMPRPNGARVVPIAIAE